MRFWLHYIILLLCLGIGVSCSRDSMVIIQKSEQLRRDTIKNKGIVLIKPSVKYLRLKDELSEDYVKSGKLEKAFRQTLTQSSGNAGIDTKLKEENRLEVSLLNLQKNILKTNNLQSNPLNEFDRKESESSRWFQGLFVFDPSIYPEFNHLSDKYGTPYFAATGWIYLNAQEKSEDIRLRVSGEEQDMVTYYYFILVNVNSGKLVYRELKKFTKEIKRKDMYPLLYDTFYALTHNVKL